jgi:hypothetical protein
MSPRAACRLQTLGFTRVYDYVLGKADWLAHGLSTEGERAGVLRAKDLLREDVATARLDERVGAVRQRRARSPCGFAFVLAQDRTLLGRLRKAALEGNPDAAAQQVMEPGPATVRPDRQLADLLERMGPTTCSPVLPSRRYFTIGTSERRRLLMLGRRPQRTGRLAGLFARLSPDGARPVQSRRMPLGVVMRSCTAVRPTVSGWRRTADWPSTDRLNGELLELAKALVRMRMVARGGVELPSSFMSADDEAPLYRGLRLQVARATVGAEVKCSYVQLSALFDVPTAPTPRSSLPLPLRRLPRPAPPSTCALARNHALPAPHQHSPPVLTPHPFTLALSHRPLFVPSKSQA